MKSISDASSSTSRHRGSRPCEGFRFFIVASYNWQDLPSFARLEPLLQSTPIQLKLHKTEPMHLKNTWRNDEEGEKPVVHLSSYADPFIACSMALMLCSIGVVHDLNGVFFFHALIPCHLTHFPAGLPSFAPETDGEGARPDTQALELEIRQPIGKRRMDIEALVRGISTKPEHGSHHVEVASTSTIVVLFQVMVPSDSGKSDGTV